MRRKAIKVCLTSEQKKLVERVCKSLGMDRSEVLRGAFMEYAKSLGLVKEEVQETITQFRPHPRKALGLASAAHERQSEQ
jgi:hypothetical protein